MKSSICRRAAITIAGLAFSASASAVSLAPGQIADVIDFMGSVVDGGVSAVSDPTLNGSIVSFVSRPLTIDVLHTPANPFLSPSHVTFTAVVDDWVVRRADTGTLDFYMRMNVAGNQAFGGSLVRPTTWPGEPVTANPLTVSYRNDAVAGSLMPGRRPSGYSRTADGKFLSSSYAWSDSPNYNPLFGSGAAIFFRSNATTFGTEVGRVDFSYYDSSDQSDIGSTSFTFFAPTNPVPEPASWAFMLAGLATLLVTGKRRSR